MGLTQPHPPILDSHIHLFDTPHLDNLAWQTPDTQLYAAHTIPQYQSCIPPSIVPYHHGFVFVETDCKNTDPVSLDNPADLANAWVHVLAEYRYVYGFARKGGDEGVRVRGIVPWAPVHLGGEAVMRYYDMIKEIGGVVEEVEGARRRVVKGKSFLKGFRYLLQDKPPGTMLTEKFMSGLKQIASLGLIFEVGINSRSTGLWQLEETVQLLEKLGADAPTLVLNHLCKPDMYIPPQALTSHPTFQKYLTVLSAISSRPNIIMKLSGVFAEIPALPTPPVTTRATTDLPSSPSPPPTTFCPLPSSLSPPPSLITTQIYPWISAVFSHIPSNRVIWGSDWPVCNVAYLENQQKKSQKEGVGAKGDTIVDGGDAWAAWAVVTELVFDRLLEEGVVGCKKGLGDVWGRNAARVYSVDGLE